MHIDVDEMTTIPLIYVLVLTQVLCPLITRALWYALKSGIMIHPAWFIYYYIKGKVTETERDTQGENPLTNSPSKCLQHWEMHQTKARIQEIHQVSNMLPGTKYLAHNLLPPMHIWKKLHYFKNKKRVAGTWTGTLKWDTDFLNGSLYFVPPYNLLFKIYFVLGITLAILVLLWFQRNFRNAFPKFLKKVIDILIGMAQNL